MWRHDPQVAAQLDACRFLLAAWNFAYYHEYESLAEDEPWLERLLESEGPSEADMREARHWSKWLTKLLYSIGDHVHWLAHRLPAPGPDA